MRSLILIRNSGTPMPPEMMPATLQAMKAWREKWRSKMESFEMFASGAGGWGVANTSDEKELSQLMWEFPVMNAVTEVYPTVNGDEGFLLMDEVLKNYMAMTKAA